MGVVCTRALELLRVWVGLAGPLPARPGTQPCPLPFCALAAGLPRSCPTVVFPSENGRGLAEESSLGASGPGHAPRAELGLCRAH